MTDNGVCPVCGGVSKCPGDTYAASPAEVGLPADWQPPLTARPGPRRLDAAAMPPGITYHLVGSRQSSRIYAHGGWTAWVSQCTYIAFPRTRHEWFFPAKD